MTNRPTPTAGDGGATALAAVSEGLASAVERVAASTLLVAARRRLPASGVTWADGGVVVTADHAIEQDDRIALVLPDEREVNAQLVGRDPSSDLAVLRVPDAGALQAAERAPEGSARVGHLALAVGRPSRGGVQASFGVVGAIGTVGRRGRRAGTVSEVIRSDATLFPGFSGGPLVDAQGRVIGINTSRFWRGEGVTIPAAAVDRVVEALLRQGRIRRAYLGIASHQVELPPALKAKVGGQETGLLIVAVEGGTPAERAGLLMGDLLVAIEGEVVHGTEDLQAVLGRREVGAEVRIGLLRGGEPAEVRATLDERP